eukprot:9466716-Pyramimonas_sp.AAC.1
MAHMGSATRLRRRAKATNKFAKEETYTAMTSAWLGPRPVRHAAEGNLLGAFKWKARSTLAIS